MEDIKLRAAGWAGQTLVHPLGLTILILCAIAVFLAPRRFAVAPMFVLACLVARQRVVLGGLDFDFIRLIIIIGWIRVLARAEYKGFEWKPIDTVMVLYAFSSIVVYTLQQGTTTALTWMLGQSLTGTGGYFVVRCLIQNWNDVFAVTRSIAITTVPIALVFVVEKVTARNAFAVFGGVPPLSQIRDGVVRAQGAFAHPILAGCFWAGTLPMTAALWWRGGMDRMLAIAATGGALFIVYACASSTPLAAVMAGVVGAGLYMIRTHMRAVRWGLLFALIALHMVKTRPVWHMFVYVNIIGGATGYHRFVVIDGAINHWSEWVVLGTKSTAHWGYTDITNQFVIDGVRGGVTTMILLIVTIALAFGMVGRLWRSVEHDIARRTMAWAMGVGLFAHVMSFFSVSYFGQIGLLWTITIAMIGSVGPAVEVRRTAQTPRPHAQPSPFRPRASLAAQVSHPAEYRDSP